MSEERKKAEQHKTTLNSPEHVESMNKMNKSMELLRRQFRYKNAKSEQSSLKTFLNK